MIHLSSGNKRVCRSLEVVPPSCSRSREPVVELHSILFLRAFPTLADRMFAHSRHHYPNQFGYYGFWFLRTPPHMQMGTSGKECRACFSAAELSACVSCSEPSAACCVMLPTGLFFAFTPCAVCKELVYTDDDVAVTCFSQRMKEP